jgi:hypothetical protein
MNLQSTQSTSPILTIPQCQALLDVAHVAFDGEYAAYYVLGLFEGKRAGDLKQGGESLGLTELAPSAATM